MLGTVKLQVKPEEIIEATLRYTERLIDSSLGSYRFRIGDYRVIFDIDKDKIVVLRVGHRREIYRKS